MSSKGIMRHARRLILVSWLTLFVPAVFAQSPPAQDRDDLDVTMHVIVDPDAKVPDEIVRRIPLPKPVPPVKPGKPPAQDQPSPAQGESPPAQDPPPPAGANGRGREFGQQVSDDAKQRSEEARNNKKPKPPDKPPGKPPSPPGRPPGPG